jgi:putative ABC transport system permease protein
MANERDDELKREIQDHLELEAEEHQAQGLSPQEARYAARRAFGSILRATEDTQTLWRWTRLEQLRQDVWYGLRTLWASPMFAIVAVTTLALSIGANAAIFSILNAALLRSLPYPDANRLVTVFSVNRSQNSPPSVVSPADFTDWRARSRSFDEITAYGGADLRSISPGDRSEAITISRVTSNFFQTMGVRPMLGRGFDASEETTPPELTNIVLSHRAWQSRFGGDPAVVGTRISMGLTVGNAGSAVIVGVMPPDFRFPDYAEAWIPMGCCGEMTRRGVRYWRVVGRLKANQSVAAARTDLEAVAAQLAETYPTEDRNWSVEVMPLAQALVGDVRRPLWVLMGAVTFIIVIGCANVAGLVLVRSASRRHEMGVRLALGASRWRLVRQLFSEGLVVALAGTAGGLLVARWGVTIFFTMLPDTAWSSLIRYRNDVRLDGPVLLFTVLLSVLTTVVLTLAPVADSLRLALADSVRTASRTLPGKREHRVYKLLVAGQFACTIVLLAGAALLMQSFVRMLSVERGYDANRLLIMGLPLQTSNILAFVEDALARITTADGVESAAVMSAPRFGDLRFPINREDRPLPNGDVLVRYSSVTADYFRVLRARRITGRVFDSRDGASAPGVVVINETFARQFFPSEDPLGRRIVLSYNNERTPLAIVGVVGDIRQSAPGEAVNPEVFVHWQQLPWIAATVVVRTNRETAVVQRAMLESLRSIDKSLPAYPSRTVDEILDSQVATPRLYTILFAAFAVVAVGLAALGIYSLVAYIVGRRTNEIAVRVALGGQRASIVRMVIGEGLRLSLGGIGVGLLGTLALTRLMRSLLFEVSPNDPMTFTGVVALLGAVAVVACYIPAHRAALTDPMVALRRD